MAGLLAYPILSAFSASFSQGQWRGLTKSFVEKSTWAYSCGDSFGVAPNSLLILNPKKNSGTYFGSKHSGVSIQKKAALNSFFWNWKNSQLTLNPEFLLFK
jgi:hypothetical protein